MRKAFCIGLSAVVLLSCGRLPSAGDTPFVLGVDTPSVSTRAVSSDNLLTSVFSVGDQLSVFLEPTDHYGALARTFQATSLSSSTTTLFQGYPEPVFFPASGTVDVYAFYPPSAVAGATRSASVDFAVRSDQSSRADYATSDLMFGSATGVARTPNPVPLTMTHALSRLTLRFSAGSATASERAALLAQLADATITLGGTVYTHINGFSLSSPSAAYTLGTTDGAPVTFATGTNVAFYDAAGDPEYSIVLPPQTLPAATTITVSPAGGSSISGSFRSSLVLERGKEAVITLTVVKRELTLACIELVPWPGTPTETGSVTF